MNFFRRIAMFALGAVAAFMPQTFASAEDRDVMNLAFEQKYLLVKPFYELIGKIGQMEGLGGVQLKYKAFRHLPGLERGAVVLLGGYTEAEMKYDEVIFDLFRAGYSVYALDHRGQGKSQHLLMNWSDCQALGLTFATGCMSDVVHVDAFDSYIADVKKFREDVVMQDDHHRKPLFIMGHSMGGLIAARYIEKYKSDFNGAILNSPMIELAVPAPLTIDYAIGLSSYYISIGYGFAPVPLFHPYDPALDSPELSFVTHDVNRFMKNRQQRVDNPDISMARPSFQWVFESIMAGRAAIADAGAIETPILVLKAEIDGYVNPAKEDEFCAAAGPICTMRFFPGSFHEILMEADSIRGPALHNVLEFMHDIKNNNPGQ